MFRNTIVVDLDGTLCDCGHRVELARAKQWDHFHSLLVEDQPFEDVKSLIKLIGCKATMEIDIIGLTGRNEANRNKTLDWLESHKIFFDELLMRPNNDFRQDHILKPELLEEFFGGREIMLKRVMFVLEDRDKVVEAWRNIGINCWQVRQGTY
jgi:hypothetical protein